MATTTSQAVPAAERSGTASGERRSGLAALLDRPLATYYLLAGTTAMLLVLGLVMVLSASSVPSYRESGSSFAVFRKQAMWFAAGLPMLWAASRLPVRAWRTLAYAALLGSLVLLALVPLMGVTVKGNQNWLDFGGPFRIQPSEPAKLALVLWGADLLARKQRLLGQWKHLLVPLCPWPASCSGSC
jgi:cell division protein FtsW (lipid II flippase)